MSKTIAVVLAVAVVSLFVGFGLLVVSKDDSRSAGVTHLSGLQVLEDGLSITNGGSLDVASSSIDLNDVRIAPRHETTLSTATTTVCSEQSPTDATSTIMFGQANFIVSSTTASTISFAKSTGPTGSSTLFQSTSVSANAQASIPLLATTTSAGMSNYTFAPGTYINVTMSGGTGTFSPTGSCDFIFVKHL